jgi:CDGSH-type Zn-finger protein
LISSFRLHPLADLTRLWEALHGGKVTGPIELRDADGKVLPTKNKVWLCRCGASTKKPFCDGTHSKIGFQAAAKAVPGSAEGG